MGLRGQKPQPVAVLKAKGTYRADRHDNELDNSGAMEFVSRINLPMPPEHFNKELQQIWTTELFYIGKTYGWVGFVDLPMFEQWCICYLECKNLFDLCKGQDRMQTNYKGLNIVNPIFKEHREAQKMFTKVSAEFGLTPSSRTGIRLAQSQDEVKKEVEFKI
jgi:P27 family predicted phage terminase small subunit